MAKIDSHSSVNSNSINRNSSADYKLLSGLFFRLLPYQILLIVINALNGIVDSLFASNIIGETAMSAIGLYSPMNHFLYALSIMLLSGSQLLYGKYIGKKPEAVQSVFSVDLLLSGIISVGTSLILVISAATDVTSVIVSGAAERTMFNHYLLGQDVGIPALVIGQQLFAFLSLENQTKRTTAASIVCFASNAFFDLIFMVIIPMGTFGLGLASSVSEWLFFAVQAFYYFAGRSQLRFSIRSCNRKDAPEIFRRGYSGALSRFVEMFRCVIVNFLMLKYIGSAGISSFAATNSFLAVIWSIPFGMVAVARMLFSVSIGEEDRRSLADTMRVIFRRCVPLQCAVSLILVLLAEPLTRLFYRNPAEAVYPMTVMGFRLLPLCMPLAVVSLAFACYAQAAEKKALAIVLPVVDGFLGVTALSLFLIPLLKMNGLYIANILNGVICLAVVIGFSMREKKHFPKNTEDLLAVPDDFGIGNEDRMDITVRTIDEVTNLSERVIAFCTEHGVDRRRAFLSGLALEEMAGNVVAHGFKKDKKRSHSADIRVMYSQDEIILRIRDDCVPFDPSGRSELLDPDDIIKNAGIRLVFSTARDIQYLNLLGLNVLTIHI